MASNLPGPTDSGSVSWTSGNVPAKKPTAKGTELEKNVQKAAGNPISSAHRSAPATNPLINKEIVKQAPKLDLKSDEVAVRELRSACQEKSEEKLGQLIKEMVPFRGDFSRTVTLIMEHGTLDELKFFFTSSAGLEEFKNWPPRNNVIVRLFEKPSDRLAKAELFGNAVTRAFWDNKLMVTDKMQPMLQAAMTANDLDLADVACRKFGATAKGFSDERIRNCSPEMRQFLAEAAKPKPKG